jgi:acetamidase/formamidase
MTSTPAGADLPGTIDDSLVNAATGPIEIRGARPGDSLRRL